MFAYGYGGPYAIGIEAQRPLAVLMESFRWLWGRGHYPLLVILVTGRRRY
jgi:hypothetical protein